MTISYTLWGKVDTTQDAWESFAEDALKICETLGFKATHYSISVFSSFDSRLGKIGGIKRRLANIRRKTEEVIDNATIVSLPEDFRTVIFDFVITLSRTSARFDDDEDYITLIINKHYTGDIDVDEEQIIHILGKHIAANRGEIYEMSISGDPEGYAADPEGKLVNYGRVKSIKKFRFDKEGNRCDL